MEQQCLLEGRREARKEAASPRAAGLRPPGSGLSGYVRSRGCQVGASARQGRERQAVPHIVYCGWMGCLGLVSRSRRLGTPHIQASLASKEASRLPFSLHSSIMSIRCILQRPKRGSLRFGSVRGGTCQVPRLRGGDGDGVRTLLPGRRAKSGVRGTGGRGGWWWVVVVLPGWVNMGVRLVSASHGCVNGQE